MSSLFEDFVREFDEMLSNISDEELQAQFEALGVEFEKPKKVLVVKRRILTYE